MTRSLKIVLIGSGNVAANLGKAFSSCGHKIIQVWSKTEASANQLALRLGASPVKEIQKITSGADIYIVAVKDDAIREIAKKIRLGNKLIAHTSGSVDAGVLKTVSENYGVLYPLQTFSKGRKINLRSVPFCIEANNKGSERKLRDLAGQLSGKVTVVNSEKRKIIHLAAVFACNFSNHMYAIAEKILKKHKLPFDLLAPLIGETARKVKRGSALQMQTGPAVRGDEKIMRKHLELLSRGRSDKELYRLISRSIAANKK